MKEIVKLGEILNYLVEYLCGFVHERLSSRRIGNFSNRMSTGKGDPCSPFGETLRAPAASSLRRIFCDTPDTRSVFRPKTRESFDGPSIST